MDTVIFTGSGFSKAIFDLPIQNMLLADVLDSPESREYADYLSDELVGLIRATNDPELVMSHFLNAGYADFPLRPQRSVSAKRTIVFFRMALAVYFREKFKNCGLPFYQRESRWLIDEYLQNEWATEDNVTLITTNYDLGLEHIVGDVFDRDYYYPGFEGPENSDDIPILKLHGSINWMEDRGPTDDDAFKNLHRETIDTRILQDASIYPLSKPKEFALQVNGRKYTPIMVPFVHQKELWHDINSRWWEKPFQKIWELASERITNADRVFFWGYSLPAADHYMFSFLLTALRETDAACRIVDYSPDDTDSNLMKLVQFAYQDKEPAPDVLKDKLEDYMRSIVDT